MESISLRPLDLPRGRTDHPSGERLRIRPSLTCLRAAAIGQPDGTWIRAILALAILLIASGCASTRREPTVPRAARPERVEVTSPFGAIRALPAPETLLGPIVYDLPVIANSWVESELSFLVGERREVIQRWMERGSYYEAFVKSVFAEYGIPTDFYHLGMIESGYIPTARSPAGAVGIWQFMPATAREVDLRVDDVIDERMDPVRSTRAAARHLRSLYRIYGDWELAAAAYNAGSGRISRGMERYSARNFWELAERGDLALETQHYVPRLFATTIITRGRDRFGFDLPDRLPQFAFDSIHVDLSVTLGELSEMTGVDSDLLSEMNPHLRRGVTPNTGYWIWVPSGAGVQAQRNYLAAARRRERMADYVVRWGDSLSRIAQRSGVSSSRIRELNPSIDFDRLMAGATIRLPRSGVDRLVAAAGGEAPANRTSGVALATVARTESGSTTSNGGESSVHLVRPGDTLSQLAQDYGVTVAALREANSIQGDIIRTGQRLQIPASNQPTRMEHVVVRGDTLWEIARRYGSSVEAIREANGVGERPIVPGQRLTIPQDRP